MSYREFRKKHVVTKNNEPSKTNQSFKDQCDINTIVSKFMKTGEFNHLAKRQGFYADVSQFPDLLGAHLIIKESEASFARLPAELRKEFGNNPLEMIEWLQNPENKQKAEEMGLIPKTEVQNKNQPKSEKLDSQPKSKSKPKSEPQTTTNQNDDESGSE